MIDLPLGRGFIIDIPFMKWFYYIKNINNGVELLNIQKENDEWQYISAIDLINQSFYYKNKITVKYKTIIKKLLKSYTNYLTTNNFITRSVKEIYSDLYYSYRHINYSPYYVSINIIDNKKINTLGDIQLPGEYWKYTFGMRKLRKNGFKSSAMIMISDKKMETKLR